jgi:hypothetical protein
LVRSFVFVRSKRWQKPRDPKENSILGRDSFRLSNVAAAA